MTHELPARERRCIPETGTATGMFRAAGGATLAGALHKRRDCNTPDPRGRLLTKRTTPGPCGRPGRQETRARPAYHARVSRRAPLRRPAARRACQTSRGKPVQQATRERTAVIRICQCGLATDDPGLLEDHLSQYGHRERVPWWDKLTQVILAS